MIDPRLEPKAYREFKGRSTAPKILKDEATSSPKRSTSSGLEPYTGEWGDKEAAHLLKRCLFSVRKEDVTQLLSMSMNDAVDLLTTPKPNETLPVNDYSHYDTDPYVAPGETWVDAPHGEIAEFLRVYSLKNWILEGQINSGLSLHQKMVLFWHNLIPTQFFLLEIANLSYRYYKILDDNAFGNFRDIIKQVTIDPAMLIYLNGYYNIKEAPDENYARELQELFTLGKGEGSQYTEQDVYEAARVLTGWTIDIDSIFNENPAVQLFEDLNHDEGDKVFSSFYGNKVIRGRTGQAGAEETDELIDMILETNEAALYICRRLYSFFVYHEIDDNTEANVIAPMAELFRNGNYEILPVVQALFKSEHFYDVANMGAYVKNPLEHTIGLWKTFEVPFSATLTEKFDQLLEIYFLTSDTGLAVGDPPSVSGWQAYYQQPSFDKIWINSDTLIKRTRIQDYYVFAFFDIPAFVEALENPSDPNALIIESNRLLQGITLEQNVIDDLKSNLLAGQQTDDYWTTAWTLYQQEPENEEYRSTVENRLKLLFQQFLQLSEFQLM